MNRKCRLKIYPTRYGFIYPENFTLSKEYNFACINGGYIVTDDGNAYSNFEPFYFKLTFVITGNDVE